MLTFYELDLGLNHVVRKWSDVVDYTSNMLLTVPGGTSGPGGVLICSENWVTWKNQGYDDVRVPIPRRQHPLDDAKRGLLITASAFHKTKVACVLVGQTNDLDFMLMTLEHVLFLCSK